MKLPNKLKYGTLFAFSGIEGENLKDNDFVGMTMHKPGDILFDGKTAVTLSIPVKDENTEFILSDIIKSDEMTVIFSDKTTVIGETGLKVSIFSEDGSPVRNVDGAEMLSCNGFFYALYKEGNKFVFCREDTEEDAILKAKKKINTDIDSLCHEKLDYYKSMPECKKKEYEKLYYKCLSINKVNVYSPQSGFDRRFTTPDRLPHHHMWLWDSMFHAMAIAQYNGKLAQEALTAVFVCQREDGFIPHMMKSADITSNITQPQVLAWAVLTVYRKTGDISFLKECAGPIEKYLDWFIKNRDLNGNGLPEWETDFSNVRCRCDESGMDNSPRFDTTERLDAIDASSFMVNDCRCLSEIFGILGNDEKAEKFRLLADKTAEKINELLWDEEAGAYCDRGFGGKSTGVLTCCSFLPLLAGVCDEERAEKLVKLLKDEQLFNTPLPVPSIARNHPDYGADMWRGCVWLNFNYMIITGLRRCGYNDLADEIKNRTLKTVNRWFEETGNVYEFYDAENETCPLFLNRKGPQLSTPDFRKRFHTITDYNWSACFTMMLIQDCDLL